MAEPAAAKALSSEQQRKALYETLALRLEVHGPEAANDRAAIRRLARSKLWLEVHNLLRSHGFTEAEIVILMHPRVHPRGCPCWDCILRLNEAVRRSTRRARLRLRLNRDINK